MEFEKEIELLGEPYLVRSISGRQKEGQFYTDKAMLMEVDGDLSWELDFEEEVAWGELGDGIIGSHIGGMFLNGDLISSDDVLVQGEFTPEDYTKVSEALDVHRANSQYNGPNYVEDTYADPATVQHYILHSLVVGGPSTRNDVLRMRYEDPYEGDDKVGEGFDVPREEILDSDKWSHEFTVMRKRGLIEKVWFEDWNAVWVPTPLGYKEIFCVWGGSFPNHDEISTMPHNVIRRLKGGLELDDFDDEEDRGEEELEVVVEEDQ